ncbi:hypothetical protein [Agrococcus sp. Marseille-P2731]|uniref:hypothetical protein n=1 Tax=Agrococcus sp. Marseille-P2731 TaxID=1841862 RepID=UPI000931452C|nr:hypothetical protein [Agrococcus sp. Marseille-P2731]
MRAAIVLVVLLVLVQGVLLVIAALASIGRAPVEELLTAMASGVLVTAVVPTCALAMQRGRRWGHPVLTTAIAIFGASGVVRTVLDASLGSVTMVVLCAAIGACLLTPSARGWAVAVVATRR